MKVQSGEEDLPEEARRNGLPVGVLTETGSPPPHHLIGDSLPCTESFGSLSLPLVTNRIPRHHRSREHPGHKILKASSFPYTPRNCRQATKKVGVRGRHETRDHLGS